MDFKKLQEMQAALDKAIIEDKKLDMSPEELFIKTLVALSVELAEVANCSEHFKHWKNNKGKIDDKRFGKYHQPNGEFEEKWFDRKNRILSYTREEAHHLTLVEECSDCLHFILSLANQSGVTIAYDWEVEMVADWSKSFEEQFLDLNWLIYESYQSKKINSNLVEFYISYVKSLDVTIEELEQAYYDKNKVNYDRLANGY